MTYGFGFRGTAENGVHAKLTAEYTDWDAINLTSSAAASPDNGTSKINADLETYAVKLSIGYNF